MATALRILLLLLALARCRSFLVEFSPLMPTSPCSAAAAAAVVVLPKRTSYRQAQHRGPRSHLQSSPRISPEDLEKARQRLIASPSYKKMVDRVEGNSPFEGLEEGSKRKKEEQEEAGGSLLRQTGRFAADVAVVLVPVVLFVTFVKLPPPALESLGSVATTIKASPLEQVLEALPWEPMVTLKWLAQGGVAILLSPVADRLVVSPAIHLWAQARLRSLSS
ncbi:unnamed protein product [Pylaiella littoralis]